jgi:hypothetical protein
MRKSLLISILLLLSFSVWSQKVSVDVIRTSYAKNSDWQIVDDRYMEVFPGSHFFSGDSVNFSLEAGKRYFFVLSVNKLDSLSGKLYTISINKEPVLLITSEIGPGDHFIAFYTGTKQEQTKITGGTTASISDFPWQVYFRTGDYRCGGSLISENWVITAAHCTEDESGIRIPASRMSVKVGANNPTSTSEGEVYTISEVVVNENYNNETLENDIALVKLSRPLSNAIAKPIRLVTSVDVSYGATDPGVMSWVTGWGLTQVSPNVFPTSLQKVQLPIISNSQASTVWRSIPSTDLMAGYFNGNKDACSGDSGGPLVVPVLGEYKLAGIVSWGSSECDTYGAYTRVSMFVDWIRSKTGIQQLFMPPAPSGDTIICQGQPNNVYTVITIPGATSYEWNLLPAAAGSISGSSTTATVSWNPAFKGAATVIMRVVRNGVTSEWSRLNVRVVQNTRFISQSRDTTICELQPVRLNVTAEGYNLVYTWFRNGVQVQTGSSSQLNINPAKMINNGRYTVEIKGYCGTVQSRTISLTVLPLTKILSVSPDANVPFGNEVTLEVNAEGHNLVYQWMKEDSILTDTNTPQLFLENVNAADIGLYRVVVTGTCGTETSDSIYLFVTTGKYAGGPEVFLWPSITHDKFNVAVYSDDYYNVFIYNMSGQVMRIYRNLRYQSELDITLLSEGSYIARIFNNSFSKSLKIIKY